jgi:hypothetical protein
MTSLKEMIARITGRGEPDLPEPGFDYRVYWTKQAMGWSPEQRVRIHARVKALMKQPDFKPDASQRQYRLKELGEQNFAAASLLELESVLRALQDVDNE